MYLALIILPLLASIASGFFGRRLGVYGSQLITSSSIFISMSLSVIIFFEVGLNNIPVTIKLFKWFDSESLNIYWSFNFDSLTVSMLIPVLIISFLVHLYSVGYMSHDPHNQRFFSYLSLFTFMMIILVTSNNLLLMFVGWEGVGVCSYLLVSFWFTRIAANQSSMSAFLTNRVGDCFLTIGMFIVLWSFGNLDYSTIFSLSPYFNKDIITLISICFIIGAMAKSSQVGLHVWLPMAMEGPTPVSALIHAATMVTAGIYLLIRVSPLLEYSSTALLICLWLGAITTIFSSLIGLFQQDIKKVIAYSTMSQLGMMMIAIGLSFYNLALFHLINHAFYKGLLFLGAGAVIHSVSDNQDFRRYGGLISFLPLTYSVMLIASLSLVAFPFMTGYYSKDFILESSFGQFSLSSLSVYTIAVIGAVFTTLYSVKVLYVTFITKPNGSLNNYKKVHESDMFMTIPLIVLSIFSIFFGYLTKDIFIGLGMSFYGDNSLFIHPLHEIAINAEFAVDTFYKVLPFILTVFLGLSATIISEFASKYVVLFKLSNIGYNIFGFFNQRFLIELFYNRYIVNSILKLGSQTVKVLDKGSIELLGPFGLEKGLVYLSKHISNLDTGTTTSYALYILSGLMFYISVPYFNYLNSGLLVLILFILLNVTDLIKVINDAKVPKYEQLDIRHSVIEIIGPEELTILADAMVELLDSTGCTNTLGSFMEKVTDKLEIGGDNLALYEYINENAEALGFDENNVFSPDKLDALNLERGLEASSHSNRRYDMWEKPSARKDELVGLYMSGWSSSVPFESTHIGKLYVESALAHRIDETTLDTWQVFEHLRMSSAERFKFLSDLRNFVENTDLGKFDFIRITDHIQSIPHSKYNHLVELKGSMYNLESWYLDRTKSFYSKGYILNSLDCDMVRIDRFTNNLERHMHNMSFRPDYVKSELDVNYSGLPTSYYPGIHGRLYASVGNEISQPNGVFIRRSLTYSNTEEFYKTRVCRVTAHPLFHSRRF